ncbi:MAG: D-alanine-D-alanine ligase, partial [Parcubacteria group bacterium GW2011_GWA1_60_11]
MTVGRYEFGSAPERVAADAMQKLGLPLVVKPADRGSSVGITVAHDADQLTLGIAEALHYSREAMTQRYIKGREVTCSVLEDETAPEGVRALPPTEIVPKERPFFDYHSKYTAGASEEITPPRLPAGTIRAIQEIALRTHNIIGCSGMSRTD